MGRAVSINRSNKYEHLVQRLTGERGYTFEESGKKLFPTIRELLTFAAFLGRSRGSRLRFDGEYSTEDIQGVIYEDTEALEFIWLMALLETEDANILKDGSEKKCAEIFEEYANCGLDILAKELLDLNETDWPNKITALCV